ncbi:winged helix-turn-helix domain-containing protein [Actinocorallia longicatena]|uniref:DUF5937 family protein n=1 Tax=Actinocorallia longicatena TaxID=111803 RepID=A0ABP6PWE8_9ACTN
MYALRFTPADLLRCRFAVSTALETLHAVRVLHDPRTQPMHLPWLRRALPHRPKFTRLIALQPLRGWTPEFLAPAPGGPITSMDEELAGIRSADPGFVREELLRSAADQREPALRRIALDLAEDPQEARRLLADELGLAWELIVEPYWPQLSDLLDRDIAYHARLLAQGGLESLASALDNAFSWRDGTLMIEHFTEDSYELEGTGLVLMPSAFIWPNRAIGTGGPGLPAVMYAARGIAELWSRPAHPPEALERLLGRARAALLLDLAEPASTTALARRHGLSPSTVSAHLTVLKDAGLLAPRRDRRQVLYRRTSLGDLLV